MTDRQTQFSTVLFLLTQIGLVALKLFGVVSWSWWLVLAPIIAVAVIAVLLFVRFVVIGCMRG